ARLARAVAALRADPFHRGPLAARDFRVPARRLFGFLVGARGVRAGAERAPVRRQARRRMGSLRFGRSRHVVHAAAGKLAAKCGTRPGVLVIHEWWGLNDYTKSRARELAGMGYVAFAADMYGEGKTTRDAKEAQALSTAVRPQLATLSKAGLEVLRKQPQVD